MSLTPVIMMFVLNYDMALMRHAPGSAGLADSDAELRPYAQQMNRLVARTDDPFVHYQAGIAWLSLGEEEDYQRHCRLLLSEFENAFRPEIASRLAKLSLLRPDLQSPNSRPTFHKLAELASGFESSEYRYWFFLTRALSAQRQGNADAAFQWNARSREAENYGYYMVACTYAVDALAYLGKGEVDRAAESLQRGRDSRDETRRQSFKDGHDVGWVDWRVFLILEREATERLDQ